jgi:hypothetical protein
MEGRIMRRSTTPSPGEVAILALLALFALFCLIFVLVGALVPDKQTGQLAAQQAFLALGPLVGSLGAMAMIWLRNRARPAKAPLALTSALWMIGATLTGFGLYTAFTPGDKSVLTNLGYSIALCLTPGVFFSAMGLGTFWYSQRRKTAPGAESVAENQEPPVQVDTTPGYEELRRRAAEYRQRIEELIREKHRAAYADQLMPITEKLVNWEQQINRLVSRLSAFDADMVIQRDLREVPARISELEAQLGVEQDPQVRQQMQETLDGYRTHRGQLDTLVSLMRRTRLQLDQTLSAMGTIYSQVQVLQAMDIESDRARQIASDIDEQVDSLGDLLSAMAEVYGSQDAATPAETPNHRRPAADAGTAT